MTKPDSRLGAEKITLLKAEYNAKCCAAAIGRGLTTGGLPKSDLPAGLPMRSHSKRINMLSVPDKLWRIRNRAIRL
jgi:hypothetical protein